ncbi:ABC transporter ATP-binding protein [Falsirhodobacter sp. 20TX0035]|uniref:ABC transporter ATP-binding protein n=1 Tax=Falsirhodobacter sp. 20TX0035 TaxID=3022019 RepID=UPI00232D2C98|nr:ABC transporter ATP-binding protein [Falsirhodobacter sp. 20TX0035]MDB6452603.1 ABC transporter ATP-binding protein [Falsirhodobacter sp. 20TX0035]
MSVLSVRGLSLSYPAPRRFLRRAAALPALHDLSFDLQAGERVGLVGASGSGKSSLLRCLLATEAAQTGHILFKGREVAAGPVAALRWYRRAVQYVPQDPVASLEPRMTVAQLVAEPLLRLHVDCDPARRAEEALDSVGLDPRFLSRRPEELSGGQAQRVAIARAIATRPVLLLTDEPVSGLDMTIRAQVVQVLRNLSDAYGTGLLMVSHDISVVAGLCSRAMVMDGGRIVEDRPVRDLLRDPHHIHTRELLNAAPPMTAAA